MKILDATGRQQNRAFQVAIIGELPEGIPSEEIEPWVMGLFNAKLTAVPRIKGVFILAHPTPAEEVVRLFQEQAAANTHH